jgi:cupin 2 domain-containing protein
MKNIFSDLPHDKSSEIFETLLSFGSTRVERIISYAQSSPDGFWYDQDENEWVVVLEGEAKLTVGDELVILKRGEYLNIPAHTKHRVEFTKNPTIWLALFYR